MKEKPKAQHQRRHFFQEGLLRILLEQTQVLMSSLVPCQVWESHPTTVMSDVWQPLWEGAPWGQLPWNAGEACLPLRTAALLWDGDEQE